MSDTPEPPRKCYRCGEVKAADDVAWRRRREMQRDSFCRPCRKAYGREHYLAHRQRYIEQARGQRKRLQLKRTQYLIEYFLTHPCVDCGETDPVVLEFDHLREKRFNIGQELCRHKWSSILAEIEKCEVVCANCHRRRTGMRAGGLRVALTQRQQPEQAGDENRTRS